MSDFSQLRIVNDTGLVRDTKFLLPDGRDISKELMVTRFQIDGDIKDGMVRVALEMLMTPAQMQIARLSLFAEDPRPPNCRDRLQDEGKGHPKSGCDACSRSLPNKPCPFLLPANKSAGE